MTSVGPGRRSDSPTAYSIGRVVRMWTSQANLARSWQPPENSLLQAPRPWPGSFLNNGPRSIRSDTLNTTTILILVVCEQPWEEKQFKLLKVRFISFECLTVHICMCYVHVGPAETRRGLWRFSPDLHFDFRNVIILPPEAKGNFLWVLGVSQLIVTGTRLGFSLHWSLQASFC